MPDIDGELDRFRPAIEIEDWDSSEGPCSKQTLGERRTDRGRPQFAAVQFRPSSRVIHGASPMSMAGTFCVNIAFREIAK
jgi:hypothetical protein